MCHGFYSRIGFLFVLSTMLVAPMAADGAAPMMQAHRPPAIMPQQRSPMLLGTRPMFQPMQRQPMHMIGSMNPMMNRQIFFPNNNVPVAFFPNPALFVNGQIVQPTRVRSLLPGQLIVETGMRGQVTAFV